MVGLWFPVHIGLRHTISHKSRMWRTNYD